MNNKAKKSHANEDSLQRFLNTLEFISGAEKEERTDGVRQGAGEITLERISPWRDYYGRGILGKYSVVPQHCRRATSEAEKKVGFPADVKSLSQLLLEIPGRRPELYRRL